MLTVQIFGGTRELILSVEPGTSVLQVLFEHGLTADKALCAGVGVCRQCAVRFLSTPPSAQEADCAVLGAHRVAAGWRLGCRHDFMTDCAIWYDVVPPSRPQITLSDGFLGVDIGTTRIKWGAREGGRIAATGALLNPQMGAGSDVMARLRYGLTSRHARSHLQAVLVDSIVSLSSTGGATALGLAGNSAMLAILMGAPLDTLAYAPYQASFQGGGEFLVHPALPRAYIPPVLGPFIGADVSAGLAQLCCARKAEYPFLFADLGTNGEFVLALDPQTYFAASVPLGPAIEGVGLACGAPAGENVVTRFDVTPSGLLGDMQTEPTGISGTGYISLLAQLLRLGLISESGHFVAPKMPLGRQVARQFVDGASGREFVVHDQVRVSERDVEEFLKVKAAVNVAARTLLEVSGVEAAHLRAVYLAGAFGEYAEVRDLLSLGFFPERVRDKIVSAGNTSLAGVLLSLYNHDVRLWMNTLVNRVRILDLTQQEDFVSRYMQAMRFCWQDCDISAG